MLLRACAAGVTRVCWIAGCVCTPHNSLFFSFFVDVGELSLFKPLTISRCGMCSVFFLDNV